MNHAHDSSRTRNFCRDSESGVILGVCAGLAHALRWPLWALRLATLGLAWLLPMATVIVYLVAALLLPERRLRFAGDGDERAFWRSQRRPG